MRTLFSGLMPVHYGQFYVSSGPEPDAADLAAHFTTQHNGLCGANLAGELFLITGLHTGDVGLRIEAHDTEPPPDWAWQEIIEVSFTPASSEVSLISWDGDVWELDLTPTTYRVRYCAQSMDEAHSTDTILEGEPLVDEYLLQFWPAEPDTDRVRQQTSSDAAYWHGFARDLPPPPTPAEREQARQQELLRQQQLQLQAQLRRETREWHGRPPTQRLRAVRGNVRGLAALDRDVLDVLADAEPDVQRRIARWAVRYAYELAELSELRWVIPALTAMDTGEALPPPFDDQNHLWNLVLDERHTPHTTITSPDGTPNCLQQAMALPAIFDAQHDDPLCAAIDASYAAAITSGSDYPIMLWRLREHLSG